MDTTVTQRTNKTQKTEIIPILLVFGKGPDEKRMPRNEELSAKETLRELGLLVDNFHVYHVTENIAAGAPHMWIETGNMSDPRISKKVFNFDDLSNELKDIKKSNSRAGSDTTILTQAQVEEALLRIRPVKETDRNVEEIIKASEVFYDLFFD